MCLPLLLVLVFIKFIIIKLLLLDVNQRLSAYEILEKSASIKKKLPLPPPIDTITFPENAAFFNSKRYELNTNNGEDENGYLIASEFKDKYKSIDDQSLYEEVPEANCDQIQNFISSRNTPYPPTSGNRSNILKSKPKIQDIPLPLPPRQLIPPNIRFDKVNRVHLENQRVSIPNKYQTIPRNKNTMVQHVINGISIITIICFLSYKFIKYIKIVFFLHRRKEGYFHDKIYLVLVFYYLV